MFKGEFQHNIDPKGRVIMPAKFRTELGESFVITKGLDDCLFVYAQPEWERLAAKLRKLSFTKAAARAFSRIFFAGANDVELDKQGRVLLPPNLRDHAKLDKELIIIGVGNRLEIWDKMMWQEYNDEISSDYTNIAEDIAGFDIDMEIE